MNSFINKPFRSSLSGMQGATPYNESEIRKLRGLAWCEQGLLIVSPSDHRLSDQEKRDLILLAERLYGRRGVQ